MVNADHFKHIAQEVDDAAADIAKAALGIPAAAKVMTLDASGAALFVHYGRDGMVRANAAAGR